MEGIQFVDPLSDEIMEKMYFERTGVIIKRETLTAKEILEKYNDYLTEDQKDMINSLNNSK